MKKSVLCLLITVFLISVSAPAAAIELNSSQSLKYHGGGDSDLNFEVQTGGQVNAKGELNMNSNNITSLDSIESYFGSCSGSQVATGINDDGSIQCTSQSTTADDQNLSEVLVQGNVANQSINMTESNIDQIGVLNSGGQQVDVGGRLNVSGNAVVKNELYIGDAPDTGYDNPLIKSVGSGSTENDHLRIETSGGDGVNQYIEMWDDQNDQPIARFKEEGNVIIPNGNLSLESNNLKNVGGTDCNSNEFIDGDGNCVAATDDQNLSEVLAQGNVANQTIRFSDGVQVGKSVGVNSGDPRDIAIGNDATADYDSGSGSAETAIGWGADSQLWSLAVGNNATANNYATAVGKEASSAYGGVAVGESSSTSENYQVAIGNSAEVTNTDSSNSEAIAIGASATSEQPYTVTLGNGASASAQYAMALGSGSDPGTQGKFSKASAEGAVAIGYQSQAPNSYEATFGNLNGQELDVNVTGNLTVHGSDGIDVQGANISDSTRGNVSFGDSLKVYGSVYANGADLAEIYRSPDELEPAEVVSISGSMDDAAERSEERYDSEVLGVVSANASHLMNAREEGHPIALEGKVPVKVTVSNGKIERGDRLVPSSKEGVAMRCETIDPMNSGKSLREIVSHNQRCEGSTFGRALENAKTDGKVLARIGG